MFQRAFRERIADSFSGVKVDVGAGTIDDLPLLGLKSKNGHDYDEPGVRRAVEAGMFDNVQIYADHEETGADGVVRSVRELVGATGKARWDDSSKKVRAHVDVIKSDPNGAKLLEMASRPALAMAAGISIDGLGEWADEKRVAGITRINSADFVTRPATVRGLTESVRPGATDKETDMAEKKLTEYTVAEILEACPGVKDHVLRESKTGDEVKSLKEQVSAKDAEIKKLTEAVAKAATASLVAKKTAKMDPKLREAIVKRFADKSATEAEVDAFLADTKELIEAAGRSTSITAALNAPDAVVADDDDDGEDIGELLEAATFSNGAVRAQTTGRKAAKED